MLASVRSKGGCPCPRCFIPRERIHNLGQTLDRRRRSTLQRKGDEALKSRIHKARDFIYSPQKNHAVNSDAVENLLKPFSLVPTSVRHHFKGYIAGKLMEITERVPRETCPTWIQPLSNVCSGPLTWSWTWDVEIPFHPSVAYSSCQGQASGSWVRSSVCLGYYYLKKRMIFNLYS